MSEKFNDIFDYLTGHDNTLSERPFCSADAVILTELSYLRFENIVHRPSLLSAPMSVGSLAISERMTLLRKGMRETHPRATELLSAAAASRRFGSMKINFAESRFDTVSERQFAAVTFFLSDNTVFAAYRGTDNTITGWRENFNMAYKKTVPAQNDSVEYIETIAKLTRLPIRVGGHSKGGNLAVFAAIHCDDRVQDRIIDIYNLDGPGFKQAIYESGEHLRIRDRIHKILPADSLIGTLLIESSEYHVIESDGEGFQQHSVYNWHFDGADLKYTDRLTDNAIKLDKTLDNWVLSLSDEQLEDIVEALFDIIDSIDANSFDEVMRYLSSDDFSALKTYRMIDSEHRKHALTVIAALAGAYLKSYRTN